MISVRFQGKRFSITVIQVYAQTSNAEEAEVERFYEDLPDLELTPKKDILFITGDWNAKVGSQEIRARTGKFGLRVQNEGGQRLRVLPRECTDHVPSSNNIRDDSTQGHYQMVSTKINYNQQKQGQGLTVAQIMSSLLPNSD